MTDWSRRRVLRAAAAATVTAAAGCSSDDRSDGPPAERGTPVTDYESLKVRDPAGDPLFWTGERPTSDRSARQAYEHLRSADDLDDVTFAPGSDAAGELAGFVRATDFESESVLARAVGIGACYELRLTGVRRKPGEVSSSFCQTLKSASAACERDAQETVGIAIRLPFPADDVNSWGSSWSSECHDRPEPLRPDGGDGA